MRGGVRRDAVSDSLSVVRAYQLATGTVRAGRECPPLKIEIWALRFVGAFGLAETHELTQRLIFLLAPAFLGIAETRDIEAVSA
jgi:hypothetical protein